MLNMQRSGKTPPKRPKPRNRGVRSRYVTTRSMNGGKFLPVNDPPQVAYQPWNHITLAWYSKPADANFGDLVNKIINQLDPQGTGFSKDLAIQMKIHSVRVWNVTGKHIALTVYDYMDHDDKDQLCGIMDAGSNTGVPRIGYELPLSFRQHVMRNDATTGQRKLFTTSSASGDSILHYVRLEWRFDGPIKGPTIDLDWQRRSYETQVKNLEFNEATSKTAQQLLDAQPSTVEKVISKITHRAAEVALFAGDREVLNDIASAIKEISLSSSFDVIKDEQDAE